MEDCIHPPHIRSPYQRRLRPGWSLCFSLIRKNFLWNSRHSRLHRSCTPCHDRKSGRNFDPSTTRDIYKTKLNSWIVQNLFDTQQITLLRLNCIYFHYSDYLHTMTLSSHRCVHIFAHTARIHSKYVVAHRGEEIGLLFLAFPPWTDESNLSKVTQHSNWACTIDY